MRRRKPITIRMAANASNCPISTPTLKTNRLDCRPSREISNSWIFVARPKPWEKPNGLKVGHASSARNHGKSGKVLPHQRIRALEGDCPQACPPGRWTTCPPTGVD